MSDLTPKQNNVNRNLMRMGMSKLEEPRALCDQIAFFVRSHDDFRKLLVTVEPEKRRDCYESLKSRISFAARPLESYISEARLLAEQEQQLIWDQTAGLSEFKSEGHTLEDVATRAIRQGEIAGHMTFECYKCLTEEIFNAKNRLEAVREARKAGWVYDEINGEGKEICPQCPAPRVN